MLLIRHYHCISHQICWDWLNHKGEQCLYTCGVGHFSVVLQLTNNFEMLDQISIEFCVDIKL